MLFGVVMRIFSWSKPPPLGRFRTFFFLFVVVTFACGGVFFGMLEVVGLSGVVGMVRVVGGLLVVVGMVGMVGVWGVLVVAEVVGDGVWSTMGNLARMGFFGRLEKSSRNMNSSAMVLGGKGRWSERRQRAPERSGRCRAGQRVREAKPTPRKRDG